ncbi:MAG: alpha/beta hydrolase [Oscillospiraceae bacterium]
MVWIIIALSCAAFALLIYSIICALLLLRNGVMRKDGGEDLNYDEKRDRDKKPNPKVSQFRQCSFPYNKWWNSQNLEFHTIESEDGLKLVGGILRAPVPTKKIALVIHGHRCVSGEMGFISKLYSEFGFNVFAPDQRAHGKSEGKYIGMGTLERDDMLRWINMLCGIFGDDCEIVLHGISMGAATVMTTCKNPAPKNIVCAIEDCGFTNAYSSFLFHMHRDYNYMPFKSLIIHVASLMNLFMGKYSFWVHSPLHALPHSEIPMLFIHGTHDNVVPFDMLRTLYDAHRHSDRKMLIVEGAAHGVSYFQDPKLYTDTVSHFVQRYLS